MKGKWRESGTFSTSSQLRGCHRRFLEQAGIFCPKLPAGGRTADKKAKPPIKRQILGSPDVLAVLLHWQLFLLLAPNNRDAAQISTFHKISVQLLLNIMRQREHFSEFFSPKIHPFRVEMTQGICGCWLFSQISLNVARPPTIRQPALKMVELVGDKCKKCPLMST